MNKKYMWWAAYVIAGYVAYNWYMNRPEAVILVPTTPAS